MIIVVQYVLQYWYCKLGSVLYRQGMVISWYLYPFTWMLINWTVPVCHIHEFIWLVVYRQQCCESPAVGRSMHTTNLPFIFQTARLSQCRLPARFPMAGPFRRNLWLRCKCLADGAATTFLPLDAVLAWYTLSAPVPAGGQGRLATPAEILPPPTKIHD